jgi:hypothetical protein
LEGGPYCVSPSRPLLTALERNWQTFPMSKTSVSSFGVRPKESLGVALGRGGLSNGDSEFFGVYVSKLRETT